MALIYRHWASKRALYLDILRSVWIEAANEIAAKLENGQATTSEAVVTTYLDAMSRDPMGAQVLVREYLDGAPFLSQLTGTVLGILIAINYIGSKQNKRWDLTANKQFSLSDQSRNIVESIFQIDSGEYTLDLAARAAELVPRRERLGERSLDEVVHAFFEARITGRGIHQTHGRQVVPGDMSREVSAVSIPAAIRLRFRLQPGILHRRLDAFHQRCLSCVLLRNVSAVESPLACQPDHGQDPLRMAHPSI